MTRAPRSWLLVSLLGPGCSLYPATGKIMTGYTTEHVVPYLMASQDVDMACETGVSMGAFLLSFERVTRPPHRAAVVALLAAGMCAEAMAREAELRQLRALRLGSAAEAQDARIAEQRARQAAAHRFHRSWKHLVAAFGNPGEACPLLAPADQPLYLLGLAAGVLGVLHDRTGGGHLGIPLDIPRAVARATRCLKDDAWWGVPQALAAAVWLSVPGSAPPGADPWLVLSQAARQGDARGVRLARALFAQAAAAAGREADLHRAIREHADSLSRSPAASDWSLLDRYATLIIEHESDRLWTQARGHRTPPGRLGTFPQEEGIPVDRSLLQGLPQENDR